jgi:hypothetical protein
MKRISMYAAIAASSMFFSSCLGEVCSSGMGTLKLRNNSVNTVQRVMIDGVNYGTLDPGEEGSYELAPGTHEFQQVGLSGGTGCTPATVIIQECKTSSYSCSG